MRKSEKPTKTTIGHKRVGKWALEQVSKNVFRMEFKITKRTGEAYFQTNPEYDKPKRERVLNDNNIEHSSK